MSTGPKGEWGGGRPGSGRKKMTLSAASVAQMLKTAEVWAKKKKKTVDDILFEFVYDEGIPVRERIACIKIVKDYTTAKLTEGGTTDEALGPAVYLPEERPDPGNVVPIAATK